jgi:uncharacterized damage-inducible protein DinB
MQAVIDPGYVRTMAAYNAWQNKNIYDSASRLPESQLTADRGAFFKSISQTLNHILWADEMWLHRLTGRAKPAASSIEAGLGQYAAWQDLKVARNNLDSVIERWASGITPPDLTGDLNWVSGATGQAMTTPRTVAIMHMFNHQTHHRGQVHAILTGFGIKPGPTDLPFMTS